MQRYLPINQRGRRGGGKTPRWAYAAGGISIIAILTVAIILGSVFFRVGPIAYSGEIYPYVEGLAPEDTTDYDAAGTYEFWTADSNPVKYEPALTWGTDTHTTHDYESAQAFYFVMKSTTANAFDHYTWKVVLPYAHQLPVNARDTLGYDIAWDSVNERWTIHFYLAIEPTPTLLGYTKAGVEVGTTNHDLSDNNYVISFDVKLAMNANYAGIGYFFDPEEGADGEWDSLYLILTCNVSAANAGWTIDSPWKVCGDGKSYYLKLDPYITNGLLIRHDEEQKEGVLTLSLTIRSADIDTSGAGGAQFTLNMKECQGDEQAYNQTWETDTLGNLVAAPTAETFNVKD